MAAARHRGRDPRRARRGGRPAGPPAALSATGLDRLSPDLAEQIRWPEPVAAIARAHRELSAEERDGAAILTDNYGEAGAVERLGAPHGLPAAWSGHNSHALWGPPPGAPRTVIAVGLSPARLARLFRTCRIAAVHRAPSGVANEEDGVAIWICRDPRGSWAALWPRLVHIDA